jgi:hypothetical protein
MDWRPLLKKNEQHWKRALANSKDGPLVLLGTSLGKFKWEVNFDSALAVALTLRGAKVHVLLCDESLPACSPWVQQNLAGPIEEEGNHPPGDMCASCFAPALDLFQSLSIPIHCYSELVSKEELEQAEGTANSICLQQIADFVWNEIAVGEHAIAGAIRFFGNANLEDEKDADTVIRRYLKAALITMFATQRLLGEGKYTVTCGSHGIYVPQGIVSEVARFHNVRVVNWHQAYRQQCVIFSEGDTYHKTLMNEPTSVWANMYWDEKLDRHTMDYLDSRQYGKQDWISFNRQPEENSLTLLEEAGVDFTRPCIGLLTNVAWDAQLHYGPSPFDNMMDWLIQTIRYFAARPELQLIVRVHPAEVKGYIKSRQPAVKQIGQAFPELPANVFVIPPESAISTYDTMMRCNSVIIYATKTGIELAARGMPVIIAGEAWIKNKGFALDASSTEEYFRLLDRLPLTKRISQELTTRARMYAFHFFMRRMIPIDFLDDRLRCNIGHISDLSPGHSVGMDVICDGILNNSDFIYPAELLSMGKEAKKVALG